MTCYILIYFMLTTEKMQVDCFKYQMSSLFVEYAGDKYAENNSMVQESVHQK